ncbi:unnamed protein product [Camellia sinensis]
MYGSQSLKLTKSRSCKASLMTSPYSPWFEKVEHNDNEHTPPNGFKNEFTGRPEDIRRRFYELNYGANIERLSRKGSQSAIGSVAAIDLEAHRGRTSTDDNITSVNTCIVRNGVHESEPKAKESLKNVKVVGLDPIEDDSKSLSNWPSEFKRLQKEIIELLGCLQCIVMRFSARDRRLIHGGVSGFVSGASESCDMDTAFACSHLHLH